MAHDVFVSHSSKDKPVADAVVAGLEAAGIRCWCAPRDIAPGATWGEAINTAIEGSRFMVIVLSGNANRSNHVVREVERAVANNVIIIPFRIEDITPTGAMAYFLSSEHWLDALSPPLKKHIQELVDTIQRFMDGREPPPKPIQPPKRKTPLWAILTPIALLAALVILGAVYLPRWLGSQDPVVGELEPTETPTEFVILNATLPAESPTPTPLPSFSLLGSWPSSREVQGVFLDGDTAYLANGADGLVILDLGDPSDPVELGRYPLDNAKNVQVHAGTAYVVDQGVLKENTALEDRVVVLDVSDPADIRLLGEVRPEGSYVHRELNEFAVQGEYLYLVTSSRLVVLDISDLDQPATLGALSFNSNISSPGLWVAEGFAYIQANELTVVDLSDPSNLRAVGGFDAGWGSDVTVADGFAYLAGWDDGLTVLDVSDPARPIKVGGFLELVGDYSQIPQGAASRQTVLDVSVSGNTAYLTYRFGLDHGTWTQALESGVIALDISDPANPVKWAVYNELEEVTGVTAFGDRVLATDSTRGLFILGVPER